MRRDDSEVEGLALPVFRIPGTACGMHGKTTAMFDPAKLLSLGVSD
jgi:hypothetical protein